MDKSNLIIVDITHARCGQCKVAIRDIAILRCPTCDTEFNGIGSHHLLSAQKFQKKRPDVLEIHDLRFQSNMVSS